MKLTLLDKEIIKDLVDQLNKAGQYNDKDFWAHVLRRIDNMERTTKIKMMHDLVEYWSEE